MTDEATKADRGAVLLLLGATGYVGGTVLRLALEDSRVSAVVAPTRRPLPSHPRLTNPIVDFDALDAHAAWWGVDGVVSALGSTTRLTLSESAYERIETEYPVAVATLARDRGAKAFAYVSSVGASQTARSFYLRLKAQTEQRLRMIGLPSLTILRPSGILGPRQPRRRGEETLLGLIQIVGPLLPRRWRVVTGSQVATALLDGALAATPGVHILESEDLHRSKSP